MPNLDQNNADAAKKIVRFYRDDPVAYAEEVEHYVLDDWQKEALNKLVEHRFLAIRSGSGVGKTFILSIACKWFLFTRPHAKVPTTAPSGHQLFDVLWTEHFKQMDRSPILSNFFVWTHTRLSVRGHEPNWYAVARTAKVRPGSDVAEGLQGFHDEENLLFIIDEASGVPDAIYPAVEGALTGSGAYCILTGNPTRREGFFSEIFNKPGMAKFYKTMHISCERDAQTVARVGQRYLDMMEERYGREHPIFKIKVLGEFPGTDADESYLVPPSYLDAMEHTSPNVVKGFPIEFGLDVGRKNAASVLCIRQGWNILKWDERQKKGLVTDTTEIINWVIEYILEYKPTHVKVDAVGIGAGVYDGLKLIYGDMIVAVVGQQSPEEKYKDRYLNLRAQGYWELRDLIPNIYCKDWPPRVISELGNIKTKPTTNAKIKIESKDDMLARAMKSPDYADAMYMAFLSEEACTGVIPPAYQSPTVIAKANDKLKKTSIWTLTDPDMRRLPGRFGAERWGGLQ